jgi:hypothetical protein
MIREYFCVAFGTLISFSPQYLALECRCGNRLCCGLLLLLLGSHACGIMRFSLCIVGTEPKTHTESVNKIMWPTKENGVDLVSGL